MASEKRYQVKKTAVAAAKKAGLTDEQFDVEQVWEGEGKSYWRWTAKPVAPTTGQEDAKSTTAAPATPADAPPPVDTGPAATVPVDTGQPRHPRLR